MTTKEKQLKASLVRTRQVIASKFRKLNRNRVLQERHLEAKYAPLTKSINKLMDVKDQFQSKRKKIYVDNGDDDNNDEEKSMEIDNNDLIQLKDDVKEEPIPKKSDVTKLEKPVNYTAERVKQEIEQHDPILSFIPNKKGITESYGDFKRKTPLNSEKIMNNRIFNQKIIDGKRKSQRKNQYDVLRIYAPENKHHDISMKAKTKRKSEKTEIMPSEDYDSETDFTGRVSANRCKVERPVKRRDKRKTTPKSRLTDCCGDNNDNGDIPMKATTKRKDRQTEIISPEDYDSESNFIGRVSAKRRKVERPVKQRVKQNRKNQFTAQKNETVLPTSKKSTNSRKIITSFEDYRHGKFIGIAPKRRKIETTETKLNQLRKNQIADLRMKKRYIKYDGSGLEHKFIPYAENIVYEYYDDPNELVERLVLLVSSKQSGNTNHDQEINSIIEELRERNIIQ